MANPQKSSMMENWKTVAKIKAEIEQKKQLFWDESQRKIVKKLFLGLLEKMNTRFIRKLRWENMTQQPSTTTKHPISQYCSLRIVKMADNFVSIERYVCVGWLEEKDHKFFLVLRLENSIQSSEDFFKYALGDGIIDDNDEVAIITYIKPKITFYGRNCERSHIVDDHWYLGHTVIPIGRCPTATKMPPRESVVCIDNSGFAKSCKCAIIPSFCFAGSHKQQSKTPRSPISSPNLLIER
jgi:hypothetical protein